MDRKVNIKNIVVQLIQFIIFYIFARYYWAGEQWYQDKLKEMLFFLIVSFAFVVVGIILDGFLSPIHLEILQENKMFSGEQTNFSIRSNRQTQEQDRIVKVNIKISRKYSVWGRFVGWILKNISYKVILEPDTLGIKVQLLDDINISHTNSIFNSTVQGIEINIGEYIRSTLNTTTQCEIFKEIQYKVIEDRANYSPSSRFVICPVVRSSGFKSKVLGIFIKPKSSQHIINFVRG
ncbi:hypothetical protein [Clostridium tertium]|uniref:hypothetical protein n=1 Tax=Clostridium tertium TaxID=1559 RepID=UPI000C07F0F4|nr:hypothetical protein [Clostridium tertium]